jgi:hypothetical protein
VLALATTPTPLPAIDKGTVELIGYGLLLGGAVVVGKLMIDGLIGDMDAAKQRREFIGPIYEVPAPPRDIHVQLSDVVKFMVTCVSVYSLVSDLPSLVSQWGSIEAQVESLVK